jgi:putative Mg2+ transporter-C (MgtC) family protein
MDNIVLVENLIKLGMAVLVGGVIGAEREYQDKAAGFRTIILITLGSALFTMFSVSMDPGFTRTRIAANIVTGIGFLGAGAIMREGGRIAGLTTAATIWLAAALGMGIGAGELEFVGAATAVTLIVLLLFPKLEGWIDRIREARSYKICIASSSIRRLDDIDRDLETCSLHILEHHRTKSDTLIIGRWRAIGAPKNHARFVRMMLDDKDIKELDY